MIQNAGNGSGTADVLYLHMVDRLTNQELFERLRLLVIQHGTQEDVAALHGLRERFNNLIAATPSGAAPLRTALEEIVKEVGTSTRAAMIARNALAAV